MADYPSLESLIAARKTGGPGEAIQSGLEGFLAGRKRRTDEETARATAALERAKQTLAQQSEGRLQQTLESGLITPEELKTRTVTSPSTPEKVKALTKKPQKPTYRYGPNGELLEVHVDEEGNTTGTTPLTGPRTAQVPAGEASNLGETKALEDLIGTVEKQYKEDPSLVGRKAVVERAKLNPAVGVASALTGADFLKADPKASEFLRNLSSLKTLRSFSLGGKQLTPTEVEQLSKAVPSEFRPETFATDLQRFKEEVNRILVNRQQALKQAGFRNVPGQTPPPATPEPRNAEGRFNELVQSGLSEDDAYKALAKEGF